MEAPQSGLRSHRPCTLKRTTPQRSPAQCQGTSLRSSRVHPIGIPAGTASAHLLPPVAFENRRTNREAGDTEGISITSHPSPPPGHPSSVTTERGHVVAGLSAMSKGARPGTTELSQKSIILTTI